MATGGCQWLWATNDCPAGATGDGIVYAYRAGAELVDMEMVLFYPSVLVWPPSLRGAFVHYEFLAPDVLDGNVYDSAGGPVLPKPLPRRDEAMRFLARAIREGRGGPHGGLFWYVGDSPNAVANAARLNARRASGGRLVAVGTTSLRLLESAADENGVIQAFEGDTAIFITPGYRFKAVDGLITNFHLPRSTLFMLVSALMGLDVMKSAYSHAIEASYRFYSYGDASLLLPKRPE
jgi:hypothetical protein